MDLGDMIQKQEQEREFDLAAFVLFTEGDEWDALFSMPTDFFGHDKLFKALKSYEDGLPLLITKKYCSCSWGDGQQDPATGNTVRIRGTEHPLCMIHTKAGLILGFLKYWSNGCKF